MKAEHGRERNGRIVTVTVSWSRHAEHSGAVAMELDMDDGWRVWSKVCQGRALAHIYTYITQFFYYYLWHQSRRAEGVGEGVEEADDLKVNRTT